MSERIVLYDIDGEMVEMYSPRVAKERVDAGLLFVAPPLVIETKPTRSKKAGS